MLRSLRDPHSLHYSPLLTGFIFAALMYLQLGLINALTAPVPTWTWASGALVFLIGATIQLISHRVLHLHIYQILVFFIFSLVLAYLLWGLIAAQNSQNKVVIGLLISVILAGSVWSGYYTNRTKTERNTMPHGPIGTLNPKTGLIDPTRSPAASQAQINESQHVSDILSRWGPLITGLIGFIVQVSSESSNLLLLAAVTLPWMVVCARGVGTYTMYVISILRWEKEHHKHMYVKH